MAEDAHVIYQEHLDIVSDAVWRRSHATLAHHIDEVLDIETVDRPHLATTRAQAIGNLVAFRRAMEGVGATAYHRVCHAAEFVGEDRIEGCHRTYVMRGGNYVIDPYDCDMILRRRDGLWRMSDTRVARRQLGSAAFSAELDVSVGLADDAPPPLATPSRRTP